MGRTNRRQSHRLLLCWTLSPARRHACEIVQKKRRAAVGDSHTRTDGIKWPIVARMARDRYWWFAVPLRCDVMDGIPCQLLCTMPSLRWVLLMSSRRPSDRPPRSRFSLFCLPIPPRPHRRPYIVTIVRCCSKTKSDQPRPHRWCEMRPLTGQAPCHPLSGLRLPTWPLLIIPSVHTIAPGVSTGPSVCSPRAVSSLLVGSL